MGTTEVISRNEFDKSYLLIEIPVSDDSYIVKMLSHNIIPGIPECKIRYIEDKEYLAYDVTGKTTLERAFLDKKMKFSDLTELFYRIRNMMHDGRTFLLDREGFLLQPKYMFTDMETGELSCLYYPVEEYDKTEERYRPFSDFLLDRIEHRDEHAVTIAYHFYKISKEEYFSFDSFIGFMEKECLLVQAENQKKEQAQKEETIIDIEKYSVPEETITEYEDKTVNKNGKVGVVIALFLLGAVCIVGYWYILPLQGNVFYTVVPGSTLIIMSVVLGIRNILDWYRKRTAKEYAEPERPVRVEDYFEDISDEDTVFFDQDEYVTLKWKEGHFSKEYVLEEFPVTVGKMKNNVQMVIEDISVSRFHARFSKQGNTVYLQDLDSTNGTYVNKKQLFAGEERIIKRGDEIQFGKIIVNVV